MEKDSIGHGSLSWCRAKLSLLLVVAARLVVVSSKDNNLCEYPDESLCLSCMLHTPVPRCSKV